MKHAGKYHGSLCILIDNAINENICIVILGLKLDFLLQLSKRKRKLSSYDREMWALYLAYRRMTLKFWLTTSIKNASLKHWKHLKQKYNFNQNLGHAPLIMIRNMKEYQQIKNWEGTKVDISLIKDVYSRTISFHW